MDIQNKELIKNALDRHYGTNREAFEKGAEFNNNVHKHESNVNI